MDELKLGLEAMPLYNTLYMRNGLKTPSQLTNPRVFDFQNFELPKSSIYHYVSQTPDEVGPPSNEQLLKGIRKLIYIHHVKGLTQKTGNVIKTNLQVDILVQQYHAKNRKYKLAQVAAAGVRDPNAPLVINYPLILKHYKYQETTKARFFKWKDYFKTIIDTTKRIANEVNGNYQEFLIFGIPKYLPALADTKMYINSDIPSNNILAKFTGLEAQLFIDLFMWLGDTKYRQKSMLGGLTDKELSQINIILQDEGNAILINLGKLNSYRKSPERSKGIDPDMIQMMLYRMYMNLMRYRGQSKLALDDHEDLDLGDEDDEVLTNNSNTEEARPPIDVKAAGVEPIIIDDVEDEIFDSDTENELVNMQKESDPLDELDRQLEESFKKIDFDTPVVDDDSDVTDEEVNKANAEAVEISDKLKETYAKAIEKELELLDKAAQKEREKVITPTPENTLPMYDPSIDIKEMDYSEPIVEALENMVADGVVTPNGAKRMIELANRYKEITAPNTDIPLSEYIATSVEETRIDDKINEPIVKLDTVIDKDMQCSTLNTFNKKYIEEVLPRDLMAMAVSIQNAGIAVTSMDMVTEENAEGGSQTLSMRVQPLEGPATNVKIKIPLINPDGTFVSNNSTYRYRSQKADIPIRKVNEKRVALTSYYGKVFIERSEKRVNNYLKWLANQIRSASLDKENKQITETRTGNVYDHLVNAPYLYSGLSKEFRTITTFNGLTFYFDYHKRLAKLASENIENAKRFEDVTGYTLCGRDSKGKQLFMDKEGNVYVSPPITAKIMDSQIKPSMEPIGHLVSILGFDTNKAPLETASLLISGKEVPLGIVLAYDLGLNVLIRKLAIPYRVVSNIKEDGSKLRLNLTADEYAIRFLDNTLIFNRKDRLATLLLSGFKTYAETIKEYPLEMFNQKEVYYNVLEANQLNSRYTREIDLQYKMFIDPITLKILQHMGLPDTYRGLLFKAAELLLTNSAPDETDASYQRIRGYERIAGAAYTELVKAIRVQRSRAANNYGLDVNPNAVWMSILQDASKETVKELNPIGLLKEVEAVTYTGNGGRGTDTMVRRTRAYHEKDMGIVSEAGVDSGKVGVNMFTSANPRFTNLYGIGDPIDRNDPSKLKPTQLLSTTTLLNVGSLNDDSKRVGFGSIMRTHIVPTKGYEILPLRTGYEQVIAHRVGKPFVETAKDDCTITAIDNDIITVTYNDGSTENIRIGRQYGSSGGLTVPQDLITTLKVNDKLKKNEVIAFNPAFFAPDPLDNKVLSMKDGVVAKVALLESNYTLEDSNAVTRKFSKKLGMQVTKKVPIFVKFDNEIHNLVKVGAKVTTDDYLCIIEDAVTSNSGMFDEESIMALQALGAMTPKAKKNGVVERIEVFYNGDKDDMTESLKAVADAADRRLLKETRINGKKGYTGSVSSNYRYDAKPLEADSALIVVYITGNEDFGGGDKCLFANQMKSTVGSVMEVPPVSQFTNTEIDAVFGVRSIYARIVLSPMLIGTTTTLLKAVGKYIGKKYLKK